MGAEVILSGDCVEVMAGMEPESVDAVVCDPPYDLTDLSSYRLGSSTERSGLRPKGRASASRGGFMGKAWDGTGVAFRVETWAAALRVAKPGAYLLAFGGTRTVHRLTVALEDAGWIIRDLLVWAYAQGFPKSRSSLKPAWEPIVLARKPGPLRELGIDACRLPIASEEREVMDSRSGRGDKTEGWGHIGIRPDGERFTSHESGRWPPNVLLTSPIFDGGWEGVEGGGEGRTAGFYERGEPGPRLGPASIPLTGGASYGDSGTYSRYFLIPKASRADREPKVLPADHPPGQRFSSHPTVKPTALMRHLIRLVTPEGGTVLDPFLGSGSTAKAAVLEGFDWIGIEREPEYVAIAEQRLVGLQPEVKQLEMIA